MKRAMGTKESDPLKLLQLQLTDAERAGGTPEGAERGAAISPPDQQKILGLWMERSGTRALRTRPREQRSAPSAVLRVLRVDLLVSCDQGVRVVDRFNDSDPLI